jgi:hypothetical protein
MLAAVVRQKQESGEQGEQKKRPFHFLLLV